MSSSSGDNKRKQEDTPSDPTVEGPKRTKQAHETEPASNTPAREEPEGSATAQSKPEVTDVNLDDEPEGTPTPAGTERTPAPPGPEGTPAPAGPVVPAINEADIVHGLVKPGDARGPLKEYVLEQSRDLQPQPYPIPHRALSRVHNENKHRGLLHREVWRVSPMFNRLAVSSLGRFLLENNFLKLHDQMVRRHRHPYTIKFSMNAEERRVYSFQETTQNVYHIEADEQVLLAFGYEQPTPEHKYIIHLDNEFSNCSLENLRWATHFEFFEHHPFVQRIVYSRHPSMNFNPRLPWQSNIHNTMYLITRSGDISSFSKHHGQRFSRGHDTISPVDGRWTKRLEVVNQALDHQVTRTMGVAEMVLDTFTGYDPERPHIIYEDGDRRNVLLDNLRSANREELTQHFRRLLPQKYGIEEVFAPVGILSTRRGDFDLSLYWVSNINGKIYSEVSNRLLTYDNEAPYASIPLTPRNAQGPLNFQIHHLVHNAHVELNQPQYEIDHVYGNTIDVSAANLRMVSRVANVKLAYALDRAILTGDFNIDLMANASPGQVARRNQVQFPTWSVEEIAKELKNGTWSPIIINFENTGYEVSRRGLVKKRKTRRTIQTFIGRGGYVYVNLYIEGHYMRRALHTLIAKAFIHNDDPANKLVVDHINRNRTDFRIENLEWVTFQENSVRAIGVGVDVYDVENALIETFCSLRQCAAEFDFDGRRYSEDHLGDVSRRRGILNGGYYLVRK